VSVISTPAPKPAPTPAPKPESPLKLKIMTFNVCWEAFGGKDFAQHCVTSSSNPCVDNIKSAILNNISQGTHVILLQEGIKELKNFFSGAGKISTIPIPTHKHKNNVLQYNSNTDSSSSFFVYTFKIISETIVTMCSKSLFPEIADIYFMGNLASESIHPNTNKNEFLPSVASDGDFNLKNNIIGGARPYIVLVFHDKNLILINIHSPHPHDSFNNQPPVKPSDHAIDAANQIRVDTLNREYNNNLQEYAFTKLGGLLKKRIPNFGNYNIIIGGDFNNANPYSAGLLSKLGLQFTSPNPNPDHNDPTLSLQSMTEYTTVSDHIYSNKLAVSEYRVHQVKLLNKDITNKFLFSDHLPVYATIAMP